MAYEETTYSNSCQKNAFVAENDEMETESMEAASLGEFLRYLALGLGTVIVTSVAVYFTVAVVIGLSLSSLN
jgi:hypothetical protein